MILGLLRWWPTLLMVVSRLESKFDDASSSLPEDIPHKRWSTREVGPRREPVFAAKCAISSVAGVGAPAFVERMLRPVSLVAGPRGEGENWDSAGPPPPGGAIGNESGFWVDWSYLDSIGLHEEKPTRWTRHQNPLRALAEFIRGEQRGNEIRSLMGNNDTRRRLEQVTDAGLFERLATAVLREMDPRFRRLAHPGVNAEGRTVSSPLDGITYISDHDPPRMVAVHHTTCRRAGLRRKWLEESNGDLPKTLRVFRRRKDRIAELGATLILTTNREPPETLVHDIHAAGHAGGIDVELYTGSAIAHFLDVDPNGQWLRREYLGTAQTQPSHELLRELSLKSIEAESPDTESWVPRSLDVQLGVQSLAPVSFIVGESGMGKTVACLKCLQDHVAGGGFGLFVSAEVLGESHSVADAIDATLRKLHPSLAVGEGRGALSLASESSPLLVVVEDVNRSASPTRLLEKLASWGKTTVAGQEPIRWRVLCPVWPRRTASVRDQSRETVDKSTIWVGPFSDEEGIAAVQRRRSEPLPLLEAKTIASSLGYDPLLIALHASGDSNPEPTAVIKDFLQRRLEGLAAVEGGYTAGEYWLALRSLSLALLERKQLEPSFTDVVEWIGEQSSTVRMLREIVKAGEVARLGRRLEKQRIIFRHDRVRNYLLADAVAHALRRGELSQSVTSDPYFAGVIGIALAGGEATKAGIDEVARINPLALFSAMRHFRQPRTEAQQHIIDAASPDFSHEPVGGGWRAT